MPFTSIYTNQHIFFVITYITLSCTNVHSILITSHMTQFGDVSYVYTYETHNLTHFLIISRIIL